MATHKQEYRGGDIEKQSPNTPQDPTAQNPITTTSDSSPKKTIILTIGIILAILISPFALAYVIVSICVTGDISCFSTEKDCDLKKMSQEPANPKIILMKALDYKSTKQKFQRLILAIVTRVGCLALLWLVVNLCVPSLKIVTLFQCPLWKWTLLVVVVLLGYPVTMMVVFTICVAISIFNDKFSKQRNLEYFLYGLRNSLTSLLHFVAILVMWLRYFRTDHGLHPSERVDKSGTWTFVSLSVGAILWVLKSAMLLKWQANAVHKRFKARILKAGFQLYFLILINKDKNRDLKHWLPWPEEYNSKKNQDRVRIQDSMLSSHVYVEQIDAIARLIVNLAKLTQRESDGIPEIVAKNQEKIPTHVDGCRKTVQYITEKDLKENFGLEEEDAKFLLQKLKEEQMPDQITYDTFQKWKVDANKNCLSVGYTLIDAFAVVSVLNRVMIGFIIVVVILLWLHITELATTKVIVLIASPFLALSFMFNDTCKTFFQGVIFSFVTHPYDVGDRCIIEGIELEVKRIGILTTTFLRIETKEKMIYPNASLATKLITNLEGEPDPRDTIELNLHPSTTKSKILGLKSDLESFFKSTVRDGYCEKNIQVAMDESTDRDGNYEKNIQVAVDESTDRNDYSEKNIQVAVKEIGSSIKMSISFTHVMNVHDVSHSQCLQKKNKQRSKLFLVIMQFLEDRRIKLATPYP